jgi:hypothetical protein
MSVAEQLRKLNDRHSSFSAGAFEAESLSAVFQGGFFMIFME